MKKHCYDTNSLVVIATGFANSEQTAEFKQLRLHIALRLPIYSQFALWATSYNCNSSNQVLPFHEFQPTSKVCYCRISHRQEIRPSPKKPARCKIKTIPCVSFSRHFWAVLQFTAFFKNYWHAWYIFVNTRQLGYFWLIVFFFFCIVKTQAMKLQ